MAGDDSDCPDCEKHIRILWHFLHKGGCQSLLEDPNYLPGRNLFRSCVK
jgi:hypothetical protein